MEDLDRSSPRYKALACARDFKTSWIELGQMLYAIWKDKLYKEWGYREFETYASKEVGIRKQTALKLLRSYSFLEREEPRYLSREYNESAEAGAVPTYEAVDVLRKASGSKSVDRSDYEKIKKRVLEEGKDACEVRKDLVRIRKENAELDPEEERGEKRKQVLKRFVSALKSVRKEIKASRMLPAELIKEADSLIHKLEAEIS
jgi:hypothetical protein